MKRGEFVSVSFTGVFLEDSGHYGEAKVQVPNGDGTYSDYWVPLASVELAEAADKRAKGGK